jgi:hypothetical protein
MSRAHAHVDAQKLPFSVTLYQPDAQWLSRELHTDGAEDIDQRLQVRNVRGRDTFSSLPSSDASFAPSSSLGEFLLLHAR